MARTRVLDVEMIPIRTTWCPATICVIMCVLTNIPIYVFTVHAPTWICIPHRKQTISLISIYIYIYIYITKWTIGTSFSEYWRYFFQLKTNTYLVWLLNKMKLAFFAENFRQTTYRMKKRVNGKDMVMKCSVIYCQYTFRPQLTPRCSNHNLEILLIWDLNKNTSSWKFCFRYFCFFFFFPLLCML